MSIGGPPASSNRLCHATSPYLRQHAHQPVDWYPWGPEALDRARRENKPIFLSIGYAACHWCHVMARESFDNPDIAALLNREFVNIKVDREERPDLDEIYMQATLILNEGQGGWPMSVWLTPDLQPFFAGTYFPPLPRYGRPGFRQLCEKIADAWRQHQSEIVGHAMELADAIRKTLVARRPVGETLSLATVDEAAERLAAAFDKTSGGLISGGTNKFPPSMAIDLMLRSAVRRAPGSARRLQLLQLVDLTLTHMAQGGIYDQLGGGFHRYSTDVEWHVPHFEKMLYDQALVSRCYLDAYQLTQKPLYARIARETLDYVLTDLAAPTGGFYSSRDADSEGVEGRYYVWTRAEVLEVLGPDCGDKFCACFDISPSGNWQDPHDPGAAKSVPRLLRDEECCARLYGISVEALRTRLAHAREKLLAARARRSPPPLDDKILCEWNGLMISTLARAAGVLDEPGYVAAARRAADYLLTSHWRNGRLVRASRGDQVTDTAFLTDYACLCEGLIDLYEATFERRWLDKAAYLNALALELFWDPLEGGFFFTAHDHEPLIARSRDVRDNATPSGNSVQLMNLLRLSALLGDARLRELAERMMQTFAADVLQSPWSAERFLAGVDFACASPVEIAIVGNPADPRTQALLRHVRHSYLPNRVLVLHNPDDPDQSIPSPLLAGRTTVDNQPTAYVCRGGACKRPATTPEELAAQLTSP